MLDVKLLGERIKALRKAKGMTQNEFADTFYVSFQAVSNWERGIAPPELDNLIRIANFFGILIDDLLRPAPEELVLGVDGGGTKTEFVVTTMDGRVLKKKLCSGSNPNDIGIEAAAALLSDAIHEMLVEFPSITTVFCGIAGTSVGNHRQRITQMLKHRYPTLNIEVNSDSANHFAMDDNLDMALISGTGSAAFVKKDDEYIRIGGWGYLLDSAGSAYDIGRDALRNALCEEDEMLPCSVTSEKLKKLLKTDTVWESINTVYEGGRPYIASLATVVFEAYEENDPVAVEIIDRNAKRLAELLNIGISKYNARPAAVVGGGMFERHMEIIHKHIAKYTDTELVSSGLPPIYGACRRARKMSDDVVSDTFYENFKKTYGGTV